jgi:hypothetical protein
VELLLHLRKPGRHAIGLTDGRDEDNPARRPAAMHTLDEVMKLRRSVGAIFRLASGPVERPSGMAAESGGTAYYAANSDTLRISSGRLSTSGVHRRLHLQQPDARRKGDRSRSGARRRAGVSSLGGYFAPDR